MATWKQKASAGNGGDFEKAPPGNHPAVLVAMIDLGVQKTDFNGETKFQHRGYFCWELTSEKNKAGQNFLIGIDLTTSLNEKAKLRQWIEAWAGRKLGEGEDFDLSTLLGRKCLLSVTEKNGYPKVAGVAGVPKGMNVPAATRPLTIFDCDSIKDDGKIEIPDWLPYLYGEPLKTVIERRCEKVEDTPKSNEAPAVDQDRKALEELADRF